MKKEIFFVLLFIIIAGFLALILTKDNSTEYQQPGNPSNNLKGEIPINNQQEENSIGGQTQNQASNENSEALTPTQNSSSCSLQQISYSLKNFQQNVTCLESQNNLCISKQINCSMEVHNLDYTLSGTFTIRYSEIYEENGNKIEIDSSKSSQNISPHTFKIFSTFFTNNQNAEKNLECSFNTTEIPKKEICN
ncbi:MAG: hypothetical protein AABX48_01760 [Nanoarchaeota archaeon]